MFGGGWVRGGGGGGGTHPVLKTEFMWAREVGEEGSERNEIPADIIYQIMACRHFSLLPTNSCFGLYYAQDFF